MTSSINNSNPIEQNLQKPETEKNKNPSNYWKEKAVKVTVFILSASLMAGVLMTDVVFNIKEMMSNFIFPVDINALEIKLNEKFSPEFMAKIKGNKDLNTQYVFKRLIKANPDEASIIKDLDQEFQLSPKNLGEILKGAHVRIKDEGQHYETWKKINSKLKRVSSHKADDTQYAIRGPFVKELLFSKNTEDGKSYTWFQLENQPLKFGSAVRHLLDYFKYKIQIKNQGPYGASIHIDSNPITLEK